MRRRKGEARDGVVSLSPPRRRHNAKQASGREELARLRLNAQPGAPGDRQIAPIPSLPSRRRDRGRGVGGHRSSDASLSACRGTLLACSGFPPVAFEFSVPSQVRDTIRIPAGSHSRGRSSGGMQTICQRGTAAPRAARSIAHRYSPCSETKDDGHRDGRPST